MRLFLTGIFAGSIFFMPASGAIAAQATPAVTNAQQNPFVRATAEEAVRTLADRLESDFLDPEAGKAYAARLRERLSAGAYASFPNAKAFAETVTADLQAVHKDGHLKVHVVPPQARGGPEQEQRRGFGNNGSTVTAKGWLAPGVAYIDFDMFSGNEATLAELAGFLKESAGAKVLIIDARRHRGGGLAEMNLIFPALYDKAATLLAMDTRKAVADRMGSPVGEDDNVRTVAGPDTVLRQEHYVVPAEGRALKSAKVYLLTSKRTASAAEHLALALKRTGRATLVGERTNGAGNFGGMVPLDKNFTFAAFIPVGRTFDPDTNQGWEGTGVAPDVQVSSTDALKKALEHAGVAVDADAALAALKPKVTASR